jgi:hypothetical protein
MVDAQDGKCDICKTKFLDKKRTHIDHCHATGEIRGVLCQPCNHAIGLFKDNIETIKNALSYLGKYK